jgi:hypothetical protein
MADLARLPFRPTVCIATVQPNGLRAVGSVREAAECLLDGGWPKVRRGKAHKAAVGACHAALGGRLDAETVRTAFVLAAKEAELYVREG